MRLQTLLAFATAFTLAVPAFAEEHFATHLGNPATRFAPTIRSAADVRARFADTKLRPDFAAVLQQWGWTGDTADLFDAGLHAELSEIEIPVGTVMPFMSSREHGRAICLRNVHWAGKEPVAAFAFNFNSKGRRYRCIVPRPCSNFYIEELGPEPKPGLAIDCAMPERVLAGRKFQACLTVRNTGDAAEPAAFVNFPLPADAELTALTSGGIITNNSILWRLPELAPAADKQLCAEFQTRRPAKLDFTATASSDRVALVATACQTVVAGISAILLEKSDDPDPVAVGDTTTYTVKVTNQGNGYDTNVRVVVNIAPELAPVSVSEGSIDGQTVMLPVVTVLAPKQAVSWTIVAKGVSTGDGHTQFVLVSDTLKSPVNAEESTTVY